MPICVAVPKESRPGERRVALVPQIAARLAGPGVEILVESGAGEGAFFSDADYGAVGISHDRADLLGKADIVLSVQPLANEDIERLREGCIVIGLLQAHESNERIARLRDGKVTSFAMELIPRISRAQNMDVLSSQASIAGYKAALMAADHSSRFFPMLTTAAGTIRPSKVLIIGVGVAGLQAIATAKRLGAIVEAYDVRPETREQVESLGARFVDIDVKAEGSGGYARELTDEEKQRQVEVLARHVADADAVISTAAVPGRPAPRIISAAMVEGMNAGSVIIDLAAESGGNCELTRPGECVTHGHVSIDGPLNVPAMLAVHASEMYAKNLSNLLELLIRDDTAEPDWEDEIFASSVVTHNGEIRHEQTRQRLEESS
ncbi:MAG: NAD(P) transhydrogenase subunit alpha [Gammaproteobacteria bacterium]|nr:NAD(P) transhydrogenase subunit alpha [Gammaproteobacteria bacterium]